MNLMSGCLGAPDERLEEKELRIAELEEKLEEMEQANFRLKQEQDRGFKKAVGPEDATLKDITKQNALLRRKLDDAMQRIAMLDKK